MKKWLIAFTASAVLVGCGGSSNNLGGSNGGTNGGGGGGRGIPTVTLGSTAQAQVLWLSGAGRRSPDSQIALIENIRIYNSVSDYWPKDLQGAGAPLRIGLDRYTLNQFVFDVPLTTGGPSKTYNFFPLEIKGIDDEQGNNLFTGPYTVDPMFNLNMELFPGRQTTIQVILNDTSLSFNKNTNQVEFNRAQFEIENYAVYNNKLNGFLSDMVSFDVSSLAVADRPLDSVGEPAEMVHFSGDSIGISGPFQLVNGVPQATYDVLNPIVIDSGYLRKPQNIGGTVAPGIYNVLEPNPQNPFDPNAKITAIQGIYRPYTDFLSNMSDFSAVALPSTAKGSNVTNQIVFFNRDAGGTITAMWQGVVQYSTATGGSIRLFSLEQLPDASATPKATGTISFKKSGGVVKQGLFSISSAPTNFPFPKTGGFVVLR